MNLNEMKLGDIISLVNALQGSKAEQSQPHPYVGRYVICRCFAAGVHAGVLVSQTGDQAVLKDSRRLWSWKAKAGVALSGVAASGLASGCKIDSMTEIALTGVIETIPCSADAERTIREYK